MLPSGKYEVIKIPDGRRTTVTVKKFGSSDIYPFSFKGFMRRYYPIGAILESDGAGEIRVLK